MAIVDTILEGELREPAAATIAARVAAGFRLGDLVVAAWDGGAGADLWNDMVSRVTALDPALSEISTRDDGPRVLVALAADVMTAWDRDCTPEQRQRLDQARGAAAAAGAAARAATIARGAELVPDVILIVGIAGGEMFRGWLAIPGVGSTKEPAAYNDDRAIGGGAS